MAVTKGPKKGRGRPKGATDKRPRKRRPDRQRPSNAGKGRKKGSRNSLPQGAVGAIKGLHYRVPEGTAEPLAAVADEAFDRIVQVMREKVSPFASYAVLNAAKRVRDEVCGPLTQKVELGDETAELVRGLMEGRARAFGDPGSGDPGDAVGLDDPE